MRTIKFRVWNPDTKQMIFPLSGDLLMVNASGEIEYWFGDTKCEIQLFTGLFDKNGKEIYEGDIFYIVHKNGYQVLAKASWFIGNLYRGEFHDDYCSEYNGFIYEHIKGTFAPLTEISVNNSSDSMITTASTKEPIVQDDNYMHPLLADESVEYYKVIGNLYEHSHLITNGDIKEK